MNTVRVGLFTVPRTTADIRFLLRVIRRDRYIVAVEVDSANVAQWQIPCWGCSLKLTAGHGRGRRVAIGARIRELSGCSTGGLPELKLTPGDRYDTVRVSWL